MNSDRQQIESLITPIVEAMGYEVWNIEIRKAKRNSSLQVYVDVPLGDERKGVNLDDCAKISSQIGALLDVEDPILESYVLEVSSPGMNRSLHKLEHYQRYIGRTIRVVLRQDEGGQCNFTGKIQEVVDNTLKLVINNGEVVTILLTNISKANLI